MRAPYNPEYNDKKHTLSVSRRDLEVFMVAIDACVLLNKEAAANEPHRQLAFSWLAFNVELAELMAHVNAVREQVSK